MNQNVENEKEILPFLFPLIADCIKTKMFVL